VPLSAGARGWPYAIRRRTRGVLLRWVLLSALCVCARGVYAQDLTPERLAVIYNKDNASSVRIAAAYARLRHIPAENLLGLSVPDKDVLSREELRRLRQAALEQLSTNVQSLLLVWSKPYAVECMSITSAFAAGYAPAFCEPGCARTALSPLFDTQGWLPADTAGWLPAMLLPSSDETLARAVIDRGIRADDSQPAGIVYLIHTQDAARNGRAKAYDDTQSIVARRIDVRQIHTPVNHTLPAAMAYFTGAVRVEELQHIIFLPGAVADHLTSTGGILEGGDQMSAIEWLRQGATASYGTVSEPCAHLGKFPDPAVFLDHYLRGDALLPAYWKSVAMPGQGLFIGEPLARPFAKHH
jgi:uncharacterized protein (TIGR03790 family)